MFDHHLCPPARPAPNRAIPLTHEAVHTVYGILGIISLSLTDYVILITGLHPNSPRFQGHDVHSPSSFLLLPLSSSAAATPSPQEGHLLGLVQHALDTTRLWFSYTLDLTSSMQRQNDGQTGDERFFWNWDMTRRIVDAGQSGRKDSVVEGGAESGGSVSFWVAWAALSEPERSLPPPARGPGARARELTSEPFAPQLASFVLPVICGCEFSQRVFSSPVVD